MSFNPAKVLLMAFAVLFKILSAYCDRYLGKRAVRLLRTSEYLLFLNMAKSEKKEYLGTF